MERLTETTAQAGTKDRILDAAEELFAERGFRETSLRDITSRARVNLAAVNYHFQSKDALIQAVFARRIGPVNQARMAMLDRFEAEARGGPVPLENILRAFLEPVVKNEKAVPPSFRRLFGRAYGEPGELFTQIVNNHLLAGNPERIGTISGGAVLHLDTNTAVERLIAFVTAGFRAPGLAQPAGKAEK